jgi:pilus assembly protein CpaE
VLTEMSAGKTLLVDLHSAYGDASVYLGAEPRFTVVDALENTHRLDEAFFQSLIVKGKGGPDLLASADQPAAGIGDTHRVRSLIEFASRHYQYVVLDCPRSDTAILDALEPAKAILIVVNQELATLRNGSRIATSLRQRFGRSRVMVVANRFDAAADIGHDDVERVVGSEVRHTIPSDYRQALAALNRGRPLVLGNGGKLGEALTGLAKALAGTEQGSGKAQDRQAGLFGRLLGKR